MSLPVQIVVGSGGTNPAAGATQWNNPAIAGQIGWIEKIGYGPLRFEDYSILPTGGIELLNDLVFGVDGDTYFWHPIGLAYQTASSTYTNGFNYLAVINALMGRLGFRPETLEGLTSLVDSTNQLCRSYRFYNDFHALVTAANLYKVQPDKDLSAGNFNIYLQSLQKSVIMRCLNGIFSEKEYLEQSLVFDKETGSTDQSVDNSGRFVGFEIAVADRFDIGVQIDAATLLFDSDITGLTLYLFKDGKKSPVWSAAVDIIANENTSVSFSELVLNYVNASTKGSRFFFGYFQDDLGSAKAIRQSICWNKTLCFGITGMSAPKVDSQTDFERDAISWEAESYGINLEISSFVDHTQAIVKKPALFDEAIGLTMAQTVLEQILYSLRSNQEERLLRSGLTEASLVQDLTGSAPVSDGPPPITGLNKRIDREIARVKKSIFAKPKSQVINLGGC